MPPGEWKKIDHSKKKKPLAKKNYHLLHPNQINSPLSPSPMRNRLKGFTSTVIPGPTASTVLPPRPPTAEELKQQEEVEAMLQRAFRSYTENSPITPKREQHESASVFNGYNMQTQHASPPLPPVYGFRGDETPTQHESALDFNRYMLPPPPGSEFRLNGSETPTLHESHLNGSETSTLHASHLNGSETSTLHESHLNGSETPTQRASAPETPTQRASAPETPTQRLSSSSGGKRTRKKYNRKIKKRRGKNRNTVRKR